ncbi:MAG: type pilus assembly PilZ [Caulobacter sp.]|nr:type pilus assembly PilZ [Caulobacter sp.]
MTLKVSSSRARRAIFDRRDADRRRDGGPACVVSGPFTWQCTLVDISGRGARIEVSGDAPWPEELLLINPRTGRTHKTRLVWRTESEAGLEFIHGPIEGVVNVALHAAHLAWGLLAKFPGQRAGEPGIRWASPDEIAPKSPADAAKI